MKKIGLLTILLLTAFSAWAQDKKLVITNYTIDGKNITNEFTSVDIKWERKKVIKKNTYGEDYNETVYNLEIKLHNAEKKTIETIILTEGGYAGGTTIYFDKVIFPRNPEKKLRCTYASGIEDKSQGLYFYDTDSENKYPFAALELDE